MYTNHLTGFHVITLIDQTPLIEVSRATGISTTMLSRLRKGYKVQPDPEVLAKLARFYNTEPGALTLRIHKSALAALLGPFGKYPRNSAAQKVKA